MLRKLADASCTTGETPTAYDDKSILRNELTLRASRRIIMVVCHMLQEMRLPGPQALSTAVGLYAVHIANANLADHVLAQPKSGTVAHDLLHLEGFVCCVEKVALIASEYTPLASVLKSMQAQIESHVSRL